MPSRSSSKKNPLKNNYSNLPTVFPTRRTQQQLFEEAKSTLHRVRTVEGTLFVPPPFIREEANRPFTDEDREEAVLFLCSTTCSREPLCCFGFTSAENVTIKQLKKRYNGLAKLVHPDKNSAATAAQAFRRLQAAYEELKQRLERR